MLDAHGTGIIAVKDGTNVFAVHATKTKNVTNAQAPQWTERYWVANLGICGFTKHSTTFGIIVISGRGRR